MLVGALRSPVKFARRSHALQPPLSAFSRALGRLSRMMAISTPDAIPRFGSMIRLTTERNPSRCSHAGFPEASGAKPATVVRSLAARCATDVLSSMTTGVELEASSQGNASPSRAHSSGCGLCTHSISCDTGSRLIRLSTAGLRENWVITRAEVPASIHEGALCVPADGSRSSHVIAITWKPASRSPSRFSASSARRLWLALAWKVQPSVKIATRGTLTSCVVSTKSGRQLGSCS